MPHLRQRFVVEDGRFFVNFEGVKIEVEAEPVSQTGLQVGDTYLAERNAGIRLLTCFGVDHRGWVISKEGAYPYDTWECYKVKDIFDG